MSLQPKPVLSFDDWLEGERAARETRSEYIDGEAFAMTGAREQHNAIVTNISGQLWTRPPRGRWSAPRTLRARRQRK